jgi:hypothetical protein
MVVWLEIGTIFASNNNTISNQKMIMTFQLLLQFMVVVQDLYGAVIMDETRV